MKKILSLLSMLMITVTAFATSYTDQLNYKLTVFTALKRICPQVSSPSNLMAHQTIQ